jgi:hypothetical protein
MLMQCMGVGVIVIITVIIVAIIRGWIQRKIRVGRWSHLRHRYMPLPQQKSRRRIILSTNNLTSRCNLGKRQLWLWAGHDMKEPANGNEKQGCERDGKGKRSRETWRVRVWLWQVKTIVKEKGSKRLPLFCVAKGMKSTPKLKLWANRSKKCMAIMTKSRARASNF